MTTSTTFPDLLSEVRAFRAANPEVRYVDLICLDISMPELDGVTALAEMDHIARRSGIARPPAVAVTANAMAHHVEEYLAAGFDAHLAKPIRREQTGHTLAALLDAGVQSEVQRAT